MNRWAKLRRLLVAAWSFAVAASCGSTGQTGSETHWYTLCERDQDCGGTLGCICGVCTRSCSQSTSCGKDATCMDAMNSAIAAACGKATPGGSVCAATCATTSSCPRGLSCDGGICVRPSTMMDASTPADGGRGDGGPLPSSDAAVDANYDWTTMCNESAPLGGSKLVGGPTVVLLSAPSGLYFGTPSAIGTGVVVRRLASSGGEDKPLGNRWLPLGPVGPGGIFYSTGPNFDWYSPSADRVVATWPKDELYPLFVGDRVFGVRKLGPDGGSRFRIVELEPTPDAGNPTVTPFNAALPEQTEEPGLIVADRETLYYSYANTFYELRTTGAPRELATVEGSLFRVELSASTLYVSRWTQSSPPIAGGIVAVDRTTGNQTTLVTTDQIREMHVLGDYLYYMTPDATGNCLQLRRVLANGGTPEMLATSAVLSFAVGASSLYVATFDGLYEVPE